MSSKALTSAAFILTLNLLFFTLVTSTYTAPCPPPPLKGPKPHPPTPTSSPPPKTPTPRTPTPTSSPPPKTPTPLPPTPTNPTTPTTPTTPTIPTGQCPKDTLKLGVCANLLSNLVNLVIGTPATSPCCTLIGGLADLDAAVCLCTAIKAGILGINLNIPVDLSLLLNFCGKKAPTGFQCT